MIHVLWLHVIAALSVASYLTQRVKTCFNLCSRL